VTIAPLLYPKGVVVELKR
jgi:hypothetical protein